MNFWITLIVFSILILGMAIGLLCANKPLTKGCNVTPDEDCPICKRPAGDPCQSDEQDSK